MKIQIRYTIFSNLIPNVWKKICCEENAAIEYKANNILRHSRFVFSRETAHRINDLEIILSSKEMKPW